MVTCLAATRSGLSFQYVVIQRFCHLLTGERECHSMKDVTLIQQE